MSERSKGFKRLLASQGAKRRIDEHRKATRAQAVRRFCLQCMGGDSIDVRYCTTLECPLWPYRLGRGQSSTLPPEK